MGRGADARGRRQDFARRPRLCQSNEIGNAVNVQRWMHDEHVVGLCNRRHGRKIVVVFVAKILEQGFVRCIGERRHQERRAVGRGTGDLLGCQRAAGAGTVLHENLLAEFLAEASGEHPRGDVSRATGAEPNHKPDILTGGAALRTRRKRPGDGPATQK